MSKEIFNNKKKKKEGNILQRGNHYTGPSINALKNNVLRKNIDDKCIVI